MNRQAWKTQPERDYKAKEEVREGKRPGRAMQLRDLETELEEKVREDLFQSYFTRPPPAQRARDRGRDSKKESDEVGEQKGGNMKVQGNLKV